MIYELEKIDLITIDKTKPLELCLGISDDVQWDHHVEEHLQLLQEKLNNYVTYIINKGYLTITNGREFESFSINIYFAEIPEERAISFLQSFQDILIGDGLPITITCEVVEPDYNQKEDKNDKG